MKGRVRIWHIVVVCICLALIGVGLTLWFYPIGAELSRGEMKAVADEFVGHGSVLSVSYIGDGKWEVKVATAAGIGYVTFSERRGTWTWSDQEPTPSIRQPTSPKPTPRGLDNPFLK